MASLRSPRQRRMEDFLSRSAARSSQPSRSGSRPSACTTLPVLSDKSPSTSLASFFGRTSEVSSPPTTSPRLGGVDKDHAAISKKPRSSCTETSVHATAWSGDEGDGTEDSRSSASAEVAHRHWCPRSPAGPTLGVSPVQACGGSLHEPEPVTTPIRTYSKRRPSTITFTGDLVGTDSDGSIKDKENIVPAAAADAATQSSSGYSSRTGDSRHARHPTKSFPACQTLVQSRLDLGQKHIAGDPRHCQQCGMMYTPGDETDEACHRRFHSMAEDALKYSGWKKEDVVLENPDGSRVICVLPSARSHVLNKMKAVQAVMDEELGAHDSGSLLQHGRKAYLYISAKSPQQQIKGVCVAEPITCGYRLLERRGAGVDVTVSDEPEPASCGVYRIWVCRTGRRQGIATCLLNAVRMHCNPGRYISKDQLAFSDPTEQGKLFASSYTSNKQFLVYK